MPAQLDTALASLSNSLFYRSVTDIFRSYVLPYSQRREWKNKNKRKRKTPGGVGGIEKLWGAET